MNTLLALFGDYTFRTVALGSALLGITSGVLGSFAVLKKESLLGDGISHAALPGVVLVFLVFGRRETEVLLLGALLSGLTAAFLITIVVRYTRIKFDAALALVMSVFFGLGLMLLSHVQKIPNSNQAGLQRFIFGQASTLMQRDLVVMAVGGAVLLALVALFWKEFKLFTFDSEYAQTLGYSPRVINFLLSLMIVIAIIIGLQMVGVILMSAMLIAPAVAARQWTNNLSVMVVLAAVFGAVSGVAGTTASSLQAKLPTGPAIVVCASIIVVFSILFAPQRGMLRRLYRLHKNRRKLASEGGTGYGAAH